MDIRSEFQSIIKEDKRISDAIRLDNLPDHIRKASELFAHTGDSKFWWPVLIAIWVFSNAFWKHWAIIMFLGIALIGAVMIPIKRLIKRKRPIGLWAKKTREKDPNSFPSGHAARTFLLAILATGIGPAWVAIIFWIWAPLVAISRVAMGVHFLLDVIGGMLLAIIVGLLWLHFHAGVLQLVFTFFLTTLHVPIW